MCSERNVIRSTSNCQHTVDHGSFDTADHGSFNYSRSRQAILTGTSTRGERGTLPRGRYSSLSIRLKAEERRQRRRPVRSHAKYFMELVNRRGSLTERGEGARQVVARFWIVRLEFHGALKGDHGILRSSPLCQLPADIWVTSHARFWGRYRKFVASATAKNPTDPFIDPEGYRTAEAEFRSGRTY